ncbi:hypothetical protein ERX46_06835 [Brumimicrobium glaciale]|uniref:DUF4350 domain-containing protein n=1 Tax=Brumimicrobium glaciale TaxID=200475 RepID=A0A4Q4KNU3_9FLAO|nr:hypothetical protein [Brumimicrobium glaciale]RYM35085.1 hypothetical protein ERX46_06835 [Brumimicrobium glaciale]
MKKLILSGLFTLLFIGGVQSQYNKSAGQNIVNEDVSRSVYDAQTQTHKIVTETREVSADSYGNAAGNQYDLAVDGAFEGQTIAVLHFYTGGGFDFSLPTASLKEKGFSVYRWINNPPSPEALDSALSKSCQLWIISSSSQRLNLEHAKVIKKFFDSGKGVYLWGDNQPYYADANFIADQLINAKMDGDIPGDKTVGILQNGSKSGIMPNHLITTGLQNIYEGGTIATIADHKDLTPIVYGSAGNLVTATYEKDGKRLIIDGGFTRLYYKWDSAGTDRYVKNAAAWLVNYERFGEDVLAKEDL